MPKNNEGETAKTREEEAQNASEAEVTAVSGASATSETAVNDEVAAASEVPASEASAVSGASAEAEQPCWEEQYAVLNDRYLRKAADFENFRKRVSREKQELSDFANQNLLLDLLPVIDDFERAIKSAEISQDFASFYEGIVMIEKRLTVQLENKWGLKRFDSAGETFDPNRHEALQMEKADGIKEAVVSEDFVKGYFLKDRVLRCAKVKVLMPAGNDKNE